MTQTAFADPIVSTGFPPTEEQIAADKMFDEGETMVLEAVAGSGKTSTLQLIANNHPNRNLQYVAFNKSIVTEAEQKFGRNVVCNTAHSLAYRSIGREYQHRMGGRRWYAPEIALELDIAPFHYTMQGRSKRLAYTKVATLVMDTVAKFCQSGDEEIGDQHVPAVVGISDEDVFTHGALCDVVVPKAREMWDDLCMIDGQLPFSYDHYLKLWQLTHPRIETDGILFDEAQDANPVMLAAILEQTHAQIIFVGDTQQQIYEWNGAVNALAQVPTNKRTYLTQSWRFGPAIAEFANIYLARLNAPVRVIGRPDRDSVVGPLPFSDAFIARTNATAVAELMVMQKQGRPAHLVGGGKKVMQFAKAVQRLQNGEGTNHPDLMAFNTWPEAVEYISQNDDARDLQLMVKLVEEFGADAIIRALEYIPKEGKGVRSISTAHKAKGREWDSVQLAGDFITDDEKVTDADLRLLYVAATRARLRLDPGPLNTQTAMNVQDDFDEAF